MEKSTSSNPPSSSTAVSSTNSNTNSSSSSIQTSLRSLNKASYKISKPPSRNPNPSPNPNTASQNPTPDPNPNPNPNPQSQPPVYNIDKSDFREIVQKLTGSPVHRQSLATTPPPPPLPTSSSSSSAAATPTAFSRLHRIRPPPLSQLSNRPQTVIPPVPGCWGGPRPALSPLPPLPTVSAAAESPITAYMRRLRGGPSPTTAPPTPLSPLGFGCVSAYGMMLSPSLLMPTSPRMPMPSPRFLF